MPIKTNIEALIGRISKRTKRYKMSDMDAKKRLVRIGLLLENQTKINLRRKGIVDSGNLLNSIQSQVFVTNQNRAVVRYGSYGVRYAAINEFGGPFSDRQRRAMFAAFKNRGGNVPRQSKGVIRGNYWRPRPYIRPSLVQQRKRIFEILRE